MRAARIILSWIMALMVASTPPAWALSAPMTMGSGTGASQVTSAATHCHKISSELKQKQSPCRCCKDSHRCLGDTCQQGGCAAHAGMFGLLQYQLPTISLASERWTGLFRSNYLDRHPPPDLKPPRSL